MIDGIVPVPGVFIGTSERMVRDGITLDKLASAFGSNSRDEAGGRGEVAGVILVGHD